MSIPLHLDTLPGNPNSGDLRQVLTQRYADFDQISVTQLSQDSLELEPERLNGTDKLELHVYSHESRKQVVLVARLDNLGKGAAGAAIQNLELMLALSSER